MNKYKTYIQPEESAERWGWVKKTEVIATLTPGLVKKICEKNKKKIYFSTYYDYSDDMEYVQIIETGKEYIETRNSIIRVIEDAIRKKLPTQIEKNKIFLEITENDVNFDEI